MSLSAIIIVLGLVTGGAVISSSIRHEQEVAAAAEAAQQAEALRVKRVAAEEEEARRQAERALLAAQEDVDRYVTYADELSERAASWALPASLSELAAARAGLAELDGSEDVDAITAATSRVSTAMNGVGTETQALDRRYIASREAAGRGVGTDSDYAIEQASKFCSDLESFYADDPAGSYVRFIEGYGSDAQAVEVYCPKFQPGLDQAGKIIPGDGGFAVADAATPLGVSPKVLAAGSYRTVGTPTDCYYEINNQRGSIITNNFVNSAPGGLSVTLRSGQGFDSSGCGAWVRQ
ncbi:hypothetical protein [Clavibacter michiganensis]|uniref:hypothetical protein n=1 Tax=Clavibacter michiganensis TaxID=28447 RepID=UPI0011B0E232|nr:hypothetical protein [Clavibacter michiganensis]